MHIERIDADGVLVLRPHGDLDVYDAPQLRDAGIEAVASGSYRICVDMANALYIDTTGLGVLVGMKKRAHAHEGWVCLADMDTKIYDVFVKTGLTKVFVIGDTVEETIEAAKEWYQ